MTVKPYQHKVQYYETDRMGVTHHSNYIRWMEEARVDYMNQLGYGYSRIEEDGLMIPVIGVNCKYKESTTFDDLVTVEMKITEYRGIRMKVSYRITKEDGSLAAEGTTEHCFLTSEFKPARLKRYCPEFHELLLRQLEPEETK